MAGDVAAVSVALTSVVYTLVARIAKISVSDYRAFPSGSPCEIDLGADGKNLLLYGENGSGKSSLARALRDLFNARNPPASYEPTRNVFTAGEEGAVSVQFTAGVVPAELRWEYGEAHPKTTQGQAFFEFASRCLFLDYRDLLRTSFGHRSGPPNLFNLLMETVLESLPVLVGGRQVKLGEVYQQMTVRKPVRHNRRPLKRVDGECAQLNAVLAAHLPEVVSEANRIFEKLGQPGTKFTLTAKPVSYDRISRSFAGCRIEFETELFGHKVAEPQHFLNEARLTALALAIYLGAARCAILPAAAPVGGALPTRLLVLDDVLIGLDLANRLPLLRVLTEDFADWQIILLTHDQIWFEMAREFTQPLGNWCHASLYIEDAGQGKPQIPRLKTSVDDLVTAERHLIANDLRAAAVYVRAAFEMRMREVAESCDIKVAFKKDAKKVSADHLWQALLRRHAEWKKTGKGNFLSPSLICKISAVRSTVLNRLSHSGPSTLTKPDLQCALQTIREFRAVKIAK